MHGGRSTLLARGDNRLLEGGGWLAGLRDPLQPDRRIAQIVLRNEALSTSGSGTQFFEHEGRRFGHLIDPRTGWPAAGLYSATVVAPTAAEADALSTAAYLLGVEGTQRLCDRRPGLRALLLAPGGDGGVVVHAYNFANADWCTEAV
jgi:thiamine biosynthesis lipoprotein